MGAWLADWRGQALGLSRLAGWLAVWPAGWEGQALGTRWLAGQLAGWRREALGLPRMKESVDIPWRTRFVNIIAI